MRKLRSSGWVPDVPDQRDHAFTATATTLPNKVDLRQGMPPVWDQKSLGSCVAHAACAAHAYAQQSSGSLKPIDPSRLMLYYNARAVDGTLASDAGTYVRTAIKTLAANGVAPEADWPYRVGKCFVKPPAKAVANGLQHQALAYKRVDNTKLDDLKSALASGLPVIFGSVIYENFYTLSKRFEVPTPAGKPIGGHAMLLVGFDEERKCFLVRNSWNTSWGDLGYHWMPYQYITSRTLTDDCWCLVKVEI
jgi:C1A family cysteine protease